MKKIKTLLVILFLTCITPFMKSQTSFNIIGGSSISNETMVKYEKIIKQSNLEDYRLKTKSVILTFTNGFKIELISAEQIFIHDHKINVSNYSDDHGKQYTDPTFFINDDGFLIALYTHIEK